MSSPQRVVSTTCSNTEIVCALGLASRLVGVDNHSDYPEQVVASLPRVGPDLFVDMDRVAALKPDLVLASLTVPGHEQVIAGLEERGLPYLAPEPTRLRHVFRDIEEIAHALGVPDRGDALVSSMRESLDLDTLPSSSAAGSRPSILVEWWPKPVIVPGRESWVTDLIEAAGGVNPRGSRPVKSEPLDPDRLDELDPDAVVISWCGVPTAKYRTNVVQRRKGVQRWSAIRNGRIFPVPEAVLGRPGPRLVEGLRRLREIVREVSAPG